MSWITPSHLIRLTSAKRYEELIPEMIHKFLIASCKDFTKKLDLPIGVSIYNPSWAGYCTVFSSELMVNELVVLWIRKYEKVI